MILLMRSTQEALFSASEASFILYSETPFVMITISAISPMERFCTTVFRLTP